MTYRILNTIGEEFDPAGKEILNKLGVVDYKNPTQENLLDIVDNYDLIVCGLGLNFTSDILGKADKLKAIATATTGLDHIDVKFAEEKGIKVLSLKGENEFLNTITGTAELALALMISIARNIPQSVNSVLNGEWDRDRFKGHSLYGYTLGIVGLGRLGRWMAQYGKSLGMNVVYYDPNVSDSNFKKVSLNELLEQSDFISIHIHLAKETEYLFNKDIFKLMKKNAYLINTSRGKIVNEIDLIDALDSKTIAGYATDVLDGEIDFINNKINNHLLVEYAKKNNNVIITPHTGGMTFESRSNTDIFIANKLKSFIKL